MSVSRSELERFYVDNRVHFFRYFQCCFRGCPDYCLDLTQDLFVALLKNLDKIRKLDKYAWESAHNLSAWRARERTRHDRLMHQYLAEEKL
jgi:DNA-directed RNA polymerase specialized sigma24 family protein